MQFRMRQATFGLIVTLAVLIGMVCLALVMFVYAEEVGKLLLALASFVFGGTIGTLATIITINLSEENK